MKIKADIVLIDSGVDKKHQCFKKEILGISIVKNEDGVYELDEDFCDNLGHGTAVYYLLSKNVPEASLFVVKLFDSTYEVSQNDVEYTLKYIYENIDCKMIHMSFGISYCQNKNSFESICNKLVKKGVIIVSAFDNLGTISYPAAFKNVIGVDSSIKDIPPKGYQYIENGIVNIRYLLKNQYLPTTNNQYKNVVGNSFLAPYITSFIFSKYILSNDKRNIWKFLKDNSALIYKFKKEKSLIFKEKFKINKAVVFPFNKEIQTLVLNKDLCDFEITNIFDVKYLGNINKNVNKIFKNTSVDNLIKNIEKINWQDDFDTFILGHIDEIENLTNYNYTNEIIKNCIKYEKKLYSLDNIKNKLSYSDNKKLVYYTPLRSKISISINTFGKLRCINKPILAVMGTSPKQGKFSLQLMIRRFFSEKGYKVGQLGTEGTGFLFGFDQIYPYGYGFDKKISSEESIFLINKMLSDIEYKNPDIIIVGGQSQTVNYSIGNIAFYCMKNIDLLIGSSPDATVLVVNYNDTLEYIKRTIAEIEIVHESKVIAIIIFSLNNRGKWTIFGTSSQENSLEKVLDYKNKLEKLLNKKCYIYNLDNDEFLEGILNYFSE